MFRLPSLCQIAIRMEAYRAYTVHNCQQFGHVWADCKATCNCLWCWGCHLLKECPEKEKTSSTPTCCKFSLAEGETPIQPIIVAADMRRRKSEKQIAEDTQNYNGKAVLFRHHHARRVLRGGAPRQDRGTAATSDTSGSSGRPRHKGTQGPCGLTPTRAADSSWQ